MLVFGFQPKTKIYNGNYMFDFFLRMKWCKTSKFDPKEEETNDLTDRHTANLMCCSTTLLYHFQLTAL
ncbi:hypothetical protein L6452_08230 [Arctium lappa]|uniref:Uncharacterized protein n=1 Tax=Arctium lappa TaxID=4217 RepID=A0ACB9DGR4_ARCLA|nr:hypothetical protein L6452_08230 [Arctium lappa]